METIKFSSVNKKIMVDNKITKRVHHYALCNGDLYYGFYSDTIPYNLMQKSFTTDDGDVIGCIQYFKRSGIIYILPTNHKFNYLGNKQVRNLTNEDLGLTENGSEWNEKGEVYGEL